MCSQEVGQTAHLSVLSSILPRLQSDLLSLWLLRSLIQESGNKAMSSGPGRDTRAGDKPSPGLAKQPRCDVSDHSNVLCPGGTQVLGEGGFLETQVTPLNPLVKVLTASAEALNLVPEMQ